MNVTARVMFLFQKIKNSLSGKLIQCTETV